MSIEKRRYERKQLSLKAEMTVGKENYSCLIQNLSEYGAYIEIVPMGSALEFYADTEAELKFQLPAGETITLNGEVRWSRIEDSQSDSFVTHLGIEILTPSVEFTEFVHTLS